MRKFTLIWQVTKSTAISAATLLFAIVALSLLVNRPDWDRVDPNADRSYAYARLVHFESCVTIMSLILFIPFAICVVATVAVTLVSGKHNIRVGAMSGIVILGLTALEYSVDIHHSNLLIRRIILLGTIPLIALSLQVVLISGAFALGRSGLCLETRHSAEEPFVKMVGTRLRCTTTRQAEPDLPECAEDGLLFSMQAEPANLRRDLRVVRHAFSAESETAT